MKSMSGFMMLAAATIGCAVAGCESAPSDVAAVSSEIKPNSSESTEKANESAAHSSASFYVVDHYDAKRDPEKDLAEAIARATTEKKRVLVQVGGDWCGWCKLMTNYMESNEAVREHLMKNFLVMKVTYEDGQRNEAFLSKYPAISGYPHLFVIDGDGKLLHSQETGSLEEGKGYNQEKFVAFLDAWKL